MRARRWNWIVLAGSIAAGWLVGHTPASAAVIVRPWYDNPVTNEAYRQEIVISGSMTAANLTNFPVLVVITNQSNPVFDKAQSNGNDIMFTTADGLTNLSHELEAYTATGAKQLVAWVKLPLLQSGRDTEIQMLYGNSALTNQQDRAGVWDSAFLGVWHMNEAVSAGGTNYDSSTTGCHATRAGTGNAGVAGVIAGANAYNGSNDCAASPGVLCGTNGYTVSAWLYQRADASMVYEAGADPRNYANADTHYGLRAMFSVLTGSGGQAAFQSQADCFAVSNWHYVVSVASPARLWLFVDGEDRSGSVVVPDGGISAATRASNIGYYPFYDNYFWWNGMIDELRVCGTLRSADWIKTCYRNQSSPAAYVTVGPEKANCQWEYRQKIVISAAMTPTTDQTNFPVLVAITNQENHLFSAAQADGNDILFTASDGTAKLAHEIESYTNANAKRLVAWVKVPALSHTADTTICMYYGNGTVSKEEDVTNVWENAFLGVWHMNEAVSAGGTNYDSSATGCHATRAGTGNAGVAGVIAGANAYNGSDNCASSPGVLCGTNGYTISAWLYRRSDDFMVCEAGADPRNYLDTENNEGPRARLSMLSGTGGQHGRYSLPDCTVSNWHYVVAVANPTNLLLFLDGEDSSHPGGYIPPDGLSAGTRAANIGYYPFYDNYRWWNGMIDELRICGTPRSADWIKACYNNQSNPGYLSFGAYERRLLPQGSLFLFR